MSREEILNMGWDESYTSAWDIKGDILETRRPLATWTIIVSYDDNKTAQYIRKELCITINPFDRNFCYKFFLYDGYL